jgi:hypothetical protein
MIFLISLPVQAFYIREQPKKAGEKATEVQKENYKLLKRCHNVFCLLLMLKASMYRNVIMIMEIAVGNDEKKITLSRGRALMISVAKALPNAINSNWKNAAIAR